MCASARAYLTYSTSLPHIIPVDVYTGTRIYDDDWSSLRIILQPGQPSIIYLGFCFPSTFTPITLTSSYLLYLTYMWLKFYLNSTSGTTSTASGAGRNSSIVVLEAIVVVVALLVVLVALVVALEIIVAPEVITLMLALALIHYSGQVAIY